MKTVKLSLQKDIEIKVNDLYCGDAYGGKCQHHKRIYPEYCESIDVCRLFKLSLESRGNTSLRCKICVISQVGLLKSCST